MFCTAIFFPAPVPLAALSRQRSLDRFSYQTWQTDSGLPQNTVHSILQDRSGFLWLATEGGLVRFDGFQFEVFDTRNTPELGSNNIQSLLEDRTGALWVASAAGLCRFENGRFHRVLRLPGLLALAAAGANEIFAVAPTALLRIATSSNAPSIEIYRPPGNTHFTGAVASSGNRTVWLGTESGLLKFENFKFTPVDAKIPSVPVNALLLDRSSRLWIGTSRGLFLNAACLTAAPVLALFQDWEGAVWLGENDGLARFENARLTRTLPGIAVISLAEDAERDLWVGSESNGVTVVRRPKFVTFTTHDGLPDETIRSVFETSGGALVAGTSRGLARFENDRFETVDVSKGLSSNVVLSLGQNSQGDLLAGTPDGLNRIRAAGISTVTSADGLPDDFVRSIYRDQDGSLWLGTRRGLSHETAPGRFTNYTQANGLGSDLVGAILRDRNGPLWIATLDGLTELDHGRFTNFTTRDGLSSNTITALYEDSDGFLFIGTQDGGLNLRRSDRSFFAFSKRIGLPTAVYGIAEDANGELWLSSNHGITRVNRIALERAAQGSADPVNVVWYGASDGLAINECSAGGHPEVWQAHDGSIWFATLKGLSVLYPDAAHLNHVLPPVVLESVTVDNRKLAPAQAREIPPGRSRIEFSYAGLSFAAPQKILYRYKLEGFDKDWIEAGSQRSAFYTNVPPGPYTFRVVARNNDGFWSQPGASLTFRLVPRFYQTLWFYCCAALALGLAIYLIYRWRVAEVQARFQAVLGERNRIAREIHDTLAQGFIGVSVQLEIVSRLLESSTSAAREHLDEARLQVRESIAEARRSIWQLRSQVPENRDFAARLSKAAVHIIGSHPVKFDMDVQGTNRPLQGPVADELLRIGQEAVTNAVRHAGSKRIHVELAFSPSKLRLMIADDGRGFSVGPRVESPDGHFGLDGMRERAAQIKASLLVDSAEGKGTKVIVEAPLT